MKVPCSPFPSAFYLAVTAVVGIRHSEQPRVSEDDQNACEEHQVLILYEPVTIKRRVIHIGKDPQSLSSKQQSSTDVSASNDPPPSKTLAKNGHWGIYDR